VHRASGAGRCAFQGGFSVPPSRWATTIRCPPYTTGRCAFQEGGRWRVRYCIPTLARGNEKIRCPPYTYLERWTLARGNEKTTIRCPPYTYCAFQEGGRWRVRYCIPTLARGNEKIRCPPYTYLEKWTLARPVLHSHAGAWEREKNSFIHHLALVEVYSE
jgi:hypothetical protein